MRNIILILKFIYILYIRQNPSTHSLNTDHKIAGTTERFGMKLDIGQFTWRQPVRRTCAREIGNSGTSGEGAETLHNSPPHSPAPHCRNTIPTLPVQSQAHQHTSFLNRNAKCLFYKLNSLTNMYVYCTYLNIYEYKRFCPNKKWI